MVEAAMSATAQPRAILATPVLLAGGTETQTLTLAAVLLAAGWEVSVCCYHESDPAIVAAFEGAGARVILLGLSRRLGLVDVVLKLRSAFRAIHPNVVHVQYLAPGFTAVLAARLAGVKAVFATVHQPGGAYGVREHALLRLASLLCTAFFSVSLAVERSWFGDAALFDPDLPPTSRRHGTIYNAVDAPGIIDAGRGVDPAALRRSVGIAADAPVLGFVGRLRREKGLDVLIRALPAVVVSFPEVLLLVVGDGPDAEELHELAHREGVLDRVVWTGMCGRLETWRLLTAMDLAVVPSRFEGFGLAAAEAQAAGLPVVAAGVDGLREVIVDGQTGLLVPPDDPSALAAAIVRLIGTPHEAFNLGRRGRKRAVEQFGMERFARATLAFYDCALPTSAGWRS
jgi:glycosyltransferase involved in cell wall biosynthesis